MRNSTNPLCFSLPIEIPDHRISVEEENIRLPGGKALFSGGDDLRLTRNDHPILPGAPVWLSLCLGVWSLAIPSVGIFVDPPSHACDVDTSGDIGGSGGSPENSHVATYNSSIVRRAKSPGRAPAVLRRSHFRPIGRRPLTAPCRLRRHPRISSGAAD